MLLRLSGSFILVSEEHPEKACLPISLRPSGSITLVRKWQSPKPYTMRTGNPSISSGIIKLDICILYPSSEKPATIQDSPSSLIFTFKYSTGVELCPYIVPSIITNIKKINPIFFISSSIIILRILIFFIIITRIFS